MAIAEIHDAVLTPGKMDLLGLWLPTQSWFGSEPPQELARCRFVDPDGEVGIEMYLVRAGDRIYHVPLTYRGAPLDRAEAFLVGTTEHSVLGTRYVYDAVGDPVYALELARTIVDADHESGQSRGAPTLHVLGSGASSLGQVQPGPTSGDRIMLIGTSCSYELEIIREVAPTMPGDGALGTLVGRWEGSGGDAVLAVLHGV